MPLLDDIKGVLNFSAFRPDPDDSEIPWSKRYAGKRSLLLNVSRTHTTWRAVNKRGRFQEGGSQEGDFAEMAPSRAEEWRTLTDGGWVGLSLNNRFIISLENNLSRRENYQEMLRVNPKAVIGAKFDRGKRYALYHHPDTTASILMSCDDAAVKVAEDVLRAHGLRAGRICCGIFAMLEAKLNEIYRSSRPEAKGSFLLLATCEGSIAALAQQDGQWTDLRCRSGVGMDSPEATLQIVAPLVQKMPAGTPVLYVHDGNDERFSGAIMEQLNSIGGKDITVTDQLWYAIGTN
ncbi:MAG: hypothetical protein ACOYMN_01145 [Roseimicrobium sp.]